MRLTQGIHRAVQLHADRIALTGDDVRLTWGEFADRVARLAAVLVSLGVSRGDRVAMLAGNVPAYVEFYFGVLWAGAVIVPVNTRWALPEKVHCLNDAGATVLIAGSEYAEEASALSATCPTITSLLMLGNSLSPASVGTGVAMLNYEAEVSAATPIADTHRSGEDLAALFYTGGTTGRSKGVMLSHNNFIANSMNALVNLGIRDDSVHLHVSPLFHVAGGSGVFTTTVAGGTHATLARFEPEAFLRAIETHRVTVTVIVPTMLNALLQYPGFDRFDVSSLKLLTYGAAPMPEALLRQAMARFPGVSFLQSYGMTELSPVATSLAPRYHVFEGSDAGRIRSAGQAVFNADVAIFDEQDAPLPVGAVGEVCVRGPMVMQGYWRQPELTANALRHGWMHTGDAGYLDSDGFLFLVDRVKDMIISGGENVYSAGVENVIYAFPGVHECAVIGVPHEQWGEAVHAIVVPRLGEDIDVDALLAHCRMSLAGFECPKTVEVRRTELPKSGAGKILKTELRQPFWAGQSRNIH
ncbi:MAG: long-chain-fatty-acid--CoA ligase [Pseudomonadales bacterium]